MARVCVNTGLSVQDYKSMTPVEVNAYVAEYNRIQRKLKGS